jgi:hypothetical protein
MFMQNVVSVVIWYKDEYPDQQDTNHRNGHLKAYKYCSTNMGKEGLKPGVRKLMFHFTV